MAGYLKFRWRRQWRRWRRDLRRHKVEIAEYFNRHVWGKWAQLGIIRRLVLAWWGVMLVAGIGLWWQLGRLDSFYLTPGPAPGGRYVEGVVDKIKLINPILPDTTAAADADRLIFNGLTRIGPRRTLEPDLATNWSVSPDGRTYTFKLRQGVKWHDGVPFTAADVVFTLTAIQNPDSGSPLAASWQGVKAEAPDEATVIFKLPNPFSPFLEATTVGVLPRHLLESTDPARLRASEFNQHPVGTGPFKLNEYQGDNSVVLQANDHYYGGRPLLDQFELRSFDGPGQLIDAFAKHQISGVSQVQPGDLERAGRLDQLRLYNFDLPAETDLFLRTNSPLLVDRDLRRALAQAVNPMAVVDQALDGQAAAVSGPLLPGQIRIDAKTKPPGFNLAAARDRLDRLGWQPQADGIRAKDGLGLKFTLLTLNQAEYPKVAELIRRQLADVGAAVTVKAVRLDELQQTYIRPRNYDLLLYGINLGLDPDVYAYWHSSQTSDPGLNLSQYNSKEADRALESGRLNSDPQVRAGKYQAFLAAWDDDLPAVALYQPNYIYGSDRRVLGITARRLVNPSDRFYNVEHWSLNTHPTLRKLK